MAAAQLGDSLRSGRTQKSGYVQPRSFEGGPGVVIDCEQSVLFARNGVRVAFLSFGEIVLKAYFFSAQFFLSLLLPLSFWGFPEFVYGIHLIFLSLVYRVPFAPFLPSFASVGAPHACALDARVSARVVRAKPSERAASFRVLIGRNVWLRMKVEKLFGVSKPQLSFSCVFGFGSFLIRGRLEEKLFPINHRFLWFMVYVPQGSAKL